MIPIKFYEMEIYEVKENIKTIVLGILQMKAF